MNTKTPKYRLHKPTGQAVVTIEGKDWYLGLHGTAASRAKYDRMIAEWLMNGRRVRDATDFGDDGITVDELLVAYLHFADGYYRKGGKPTKEPKNIRLAIRSLRRLYGRSPAGKFGPLGLKAIRDEMIAEDICRKEINRRIGRVVRVFKWGVENELIPPSVHHGLQSVAGLKSGRSKARESPPVRPVPEAFVDAIRPHVSRQVWAMVELQRLTGMRPAEVVSIMTINIDMSSHTWVYKPSRHKTEHHEKERLIYLGPRARAVLKPWLRPVLNEPLFSPAEATAERQAAKRKARKTPVQPSQVDRSGECPLKFSGSAYTVDSYRRAIAYGCKRADVPRWHPHQLRHNAATWLRKEFGLDAARAILGHSSPAVTEIYAEIDKDKARDVMESAG